MKIVVKIKCYTLGTKFPDPRAWMKTQTDESLNLSNIHQFYLFTNNGSLESAWIRISFFFSKLVWFTFDDIAYRSYCCIRYVTFG